MIFLWNNKKFFYHFENRNKQQTAVFLHGWGGNHLSLISLFDNFKDFNILTFDFWGSGQSDKPSDEFDLYSYSKVLLDLIAFLELENLTLIGHSFGGRVAIVCAFETSEVKRLILIASAGIVARKTLLKRLKIVNYKMKKSLYRKNPQKLSKFGSKDFKKLSEDEKKVFVRIVNEDLSKYLKFLKQKTLLIWGNKDKDTPLYMARKMNKLLKNSKLVIIKRGTHFSYIEHNFVVREKIKEFLESGS